MGVLELDIGNTRIKWRYVGDSSLGSLGGAAETLEQLEQDIENKTLVLGVSLNSTLEKIRYCSVRSKKFNQQFEDWCQQVLRLSPLRALVAQECHGVTNQYADVSRLGIDRWLAMVSAYNACSGACVIVDGGTALTIDVLDDDGLHLGGYIVPGLETLRWSIDARTGIDVSKLREEAGGKRPEALDLGHSSIDAICNGTAAMLVTLIETVLIELLPGSNHAGADDPNKSKLRLFLSGGDAQLLFQELSQTVLFEESIEAEIVTDLVMDGLVLACGD